MTTQTNFVISTTGGFVRTANGRASLGWPWSQAQTFTEAEAREWAQKLSVPEPLATVYAVPNLIEPVARFVGGKEV